MRMIGQQVPWISARLNKQSPQGGFKGLAEGQADLLCQTDRTTKRIIADKASWGSGTLGLDFLTLWNTLVFGSKHEILGLFNQE